MNKGLLVVVCVAFCLYLVSSEYTLCGKVDSLLRITNATISPNPPVRGKSFVVNYSGKVEQQVPGGSQTFTVWQQVYGKWVVSPYAFTFDLCKENKCPFGPGPFSLNMTEQLPSFVPAGDYAVGVQVNSTTHASIGCVHVLFELK
eukprot:TRINITY_DN143_c0_g1_i1.p1 TRINITY_DN143_c0_g1~~TRINITY_DN143_c0_g1_i1.p1  ORF type:complete len:145 (+),score=25.50 TRINITY_DN143_c0_g1_i1:96-530(+)